MKEYDKELASGQRFPFGENWRRFLMVLNDDQIAEAEKSLKQMIEVEDLKGKSFLDVGSGSGLFSLAARRLGARVYSFDYDPHSVACTAELKRRYFPADPDWVIENGSVLDKDYLKSLGTFDIVYSWGVLHHTGAMWLALEQVIMPVHAGGKLFIAVYNNQDWVSDFWRNVKRTYCSGRIGKLFIPAIFVPYFVLRGIVADLVIRRRNPLRRYSHYKNNRGMSMVRDWIDWLGGYPFEVAKPEEVFHFYRDRGFILVKLKTCGGGLGCNEFVFERRKNGSR